MTFPLLAVLGALCITLASAAAAPVSSDVVSDALGLAKKGWNLRMGQEAADPVGTGALVTGVGFIIAGIGEFVEGTHAIHAARMDAEKMMLSQSLQHSQADLVELNSTITGGFPSSEMMLPIIARDSHALLVNAHTLHNRATAVLGNVESALHHYVMGAYAGGAGGLACLVAGAMAFRPGWLLCSVVGAAVEITSGVWAILASDDADKAKSMRDAMEDFMVDASEVEANLVWDSGTQTFILRDSVDEFWADVATLSQGLATARARLRQILPQLSEGGGILLASSQAVPSAVWPTTVAKQTPLVLVSLCAFTNVLLSVVQLVTYLRRRAACSPEDSYITLAP